MQIGLPFERILFLTAEKTWQKNICNARFSANIIIYFPESFDLFLNEFKYT